MNRLDGFLFHRHLDDDEAAQDVIHRHWLFGIRLLFWPSLSFLVAWAVLYAVPFLTMFYVSALWAVASLVWWLRNFFDYYLDAWIITDHGVIDVQWNGWFHRQSARILYSDIQGISYEIQGVVGTLLTYGTVGIEKISTGNTVSLENVAHPRRVESLVLRCMEDYLHSKNLKNAKHVQDLLAEMVTQEVQLQGFRKNK
ncbi:MAG: PH domain-containing protein [Candidatus Peregrinibacteria bacterium]